MAPGALGVGKNSDPWLDRPSPIGPLMEAAGRAAPDADPRPPPMPRVFGAAAAEYFRMYGGGVGCLAKIGELWGILSEVYVLIRRAVVAVAPF
jgi:hypothetical protein